MDRRQFLTFSAAASLFPLAAQAAYHATPYRTGLLMEMRETGNAFILNFNASWSLTSQIKRDTIGALKANNPQYSSYITFIDIDWDTYGPSQMAQRLKIQRHSTLIALQGKGEIGRLEAEIDERRIKAFLDKTLEAARAS
ncbi:thioredoxin [Thalassococcus sp. S3]|uniref:thioredoxin n=1 Tax=Thalassococcus sp. S3 TaxID=2017482 RepID=UPI00102489CF|nr:thioredoxin [Thalassococcus sp. S3]QBF29769.1 thiol reductase thioredoxin [Thalassococcus sp. S3]